MYTITLFGMGGELDRRVASTNEEAAQVAIAMISEVGVLCSGDRVEIAGEYEDGDGEGS